MAEGAESEEALMRAAAKVVTGVLVVFALALVLGAAVHFNEALAQQRVIADRAYIVNTSSAALETVACGTSPCTIGAASTTVLNVNAGRHECLLQNVGATDFYCRKGAGTVTTANFHFILKAASAALKGDGGAYACNAGPVVWSGPIVCLGSAAGGSLAASGD